MSLLFLPFRHIFKSRFKRLAFQSLRHIHIHKQTWLRAKLQSCRVETLNSKSSASATRLASDIYGSCLFVVGPADVCTSSAEKEQQGSFSTFRRSFMLSFILPPPRTENNFQRQIAHHITRAAFVGLLLNLLQSFTTICSFSSLQ